MDYKEFFKKKIKKIEDYKLKVENILKDFSNKNIFNNDFKKAFIKNNKLNNIIELYKNFISITNEIYSVKKINSLEIEELVKEELEILLTKENEIKKKLKFLINNFENKYLGCFIEIKSGTGGIESSLFINDLYKMYIKYLYKKKWNVELISKIPNQQGGYKEIIIKILNEKSFNYLRFESGGHRVQRIPETESQGRVHTSTCIIAVTPILEEKQFNSINNSDLRIDTFRSSGAGGQHVNTTDSAIRITHIPTGIVVECQDERSQHKNKSKAMSVLQSRIYLMEKNKNKQEKDELKKNLLGSGLRSDRIRTYNFIQNRITDHRIFFSSYRLNEILNGDLDIIINLIIKKFNDCF